MFGELISGGVSNGVERWGAILCAGFEKEGQVAVRPGHFCPINSWVVKTETRTVQFNRYATEYDVNNEPIWETQSRAETREISYIDETTQDEYQLEESSTLRLKCLAVAASAFLFQSVALLLNLINRIAKLISLAHLWYPRDEARPLSARFLEMGKDLLRVLFTPVFFVGIQLSALYGIASPLNGRKLVATFERSAYTEEGIAPCFQPDSSRHLIGKYGW